ncbi:hypothetical protein HDG38_006659 [Paraburkholderia sp. WSM4177]|nr:hypothetical protein [Paraburkholderia sp. WSM4177]MBB5488445.1 hypothetical protein [Paraburkholderia sp. WSM4180]
METIRFSAWCVFFSWVLNRRSVGAPGRRLPDASLTLM